MVCRECAQCAFCYLPAETWDVLSSRTPQLRLLGGSVLFAEGEAPKGVHVLCEGTVRLSMLGDNGFADRGSRKPEETYFELH